MTSKTILMAYQDDSWVKSLSSLSSDMGCRVEATRLVSDVVKKIRGKDPCVILLDAEMEEIKAYDLVPLFKKLRPRVQIIVISSDESIRFAKCLRDAGIFYQAMKPIDSGEIRSAVACAFEKIDREQPEKWFFPFLTPGPVPA